MNMVLDQGNIEHRVLQRMGRYDKRTKHSSLGQRPYIIETMHSYTLPM